MKYEQILNRTKVDIPIQIFAYLITIYGVNWKLTS